MPESEEPQQEQVHAGYMTSHADRSVQQYRLDYTPEFRNLRITLTGYRLTNDGKNIKVSDNGALCLEHFNALLGFLYGSSQKAITLSCYHQEQAENFVIGDLDRIRAWAVSTCFFCEKCGVNHDFTKIQLILNPCQAFLFGNYHRGVGGFEAGKLSTMQSVTSLEDYRNRESQPSGFLGMIKRKWG